MREIIRGQLHILFFRAGDPGIGKRRNAFLLFGLATAWLAGIGRYWDNPRALVYQHLGLGSVIYCFVLAAIVFAIIYPLRPRNWSYRSVLTFISLTSLPAFLYAIPVEKWMSMSAAQTTNMWFLLIVAVWRVALFVSYLKNSAGLKGGAIVTACFLPIVAIITALTAFNLEHVIFNIMAGMRENDASGNDVAYIVVSVLTVLSYFVLPVFLFAYFYFIVQARKAPPAG